MILRSLLLLLPLLVLLSGPEFVLSQTRYKQQVIAILQDDPAILKAAQFLYQKHDTISHVVKWNPDATKPNGGTFDQVRWNPDTKKFDPIQNPEPLPIGDKQPFKWADTRVQVVGHGEFSDFKNKVSFGGASPEEIIDRVVGQISSGESMGRISIVGCTRNAEIVEKRAKKQEDHPGYKLTEKFMARLKAKKIFNTEVSVRSALVSVDQSGRKLTGELYRVDYDKKRIEVGIDWKHKKGSNKFVGSFDKKKKLKIETDDVLKRTNANQIESHFFGILPPESAVHFTPKTSGAQAAPKSYRVSDKSAFSWVDKMAQNTYNNIEAGSRATEVPHRVQFFGNRGLVENQPVREIHSIDDLLSELRHFGASGPNGVKETESPPTGPITEAGHNAICYRYGDWVVSMNLDNFYVNVEGVITSGADPAIKTEKIKELQNYNWEKTRPDYPNLLEKSGDGFFDHVKSWINGEHDKIGLEIENGFDAQSGAAMFLSESIRCFQNHITNMMSLDLVRHGYLTKEYFFRSHPMARGGTWQIEDPITMRLKTGLDLVRDPRIGTVKEYSKSVDTIERISRISKTWLSHTDSNDVTGSRDRAPGAEKVDYNAQGGTNLLDQLESIGSTPPQSKTYLREYELHQASDRLLSSTISEAEIESVNTQVEEFAIAEDISLPVKASLALANDHAYVADRIARQVELKEQQTGKKYEVLPDSIEFEENDNSIRFQVQEERNPASQPEEISTTIDKSKLASKEMVENLQKESEDLKQPSGSQEGRAARINKGLAIYGVVRGFTGAISALEDGDIKDGLIGAAQSLHGVGELSGFNRKLYRTAGKYLGKVLGKDVKSVTESVSTIAGEDASNLARAAEGEAVSTVGEVAGENIPIIGTAFGIYNIYEDFQKHSTIGYIDGGLDIAITGLSLLGPEAEPVVLALTVIRMGIDSFYNEISNELKNLPSDASVGQKIGAVFKGIGKAFEDLFEEFTLPGQIFGAIENSKKLDDQYDSDGEFLDKLSDYHNYFTVVKEEGSGASEINFAGGSESWNGGDITFHLGEDGTSQLSLRAVTDEGNDIYETHTVNTANVEDIVMGIGESHYISFKKKTVKFLWFIPVDSAYVISGTTGERETLHGTYYGNSKNNKFMAVQHLPPKGDSLEYNLDDYHYKLFGGDGDDTFYLGPQHSYVEGNDGSDAYFIGASSVLTEINNYADDGKTDFMIINVTFNQLIPQRQGMDLRLSHSNDHVIWVDYWFSGDTYQHMVFKTADGVLFKVSATNTGQVELVPYALNGAGASNPQVYDAREQGRLQVMTLVGSKYDDKLYGNDLNNQMNGGFGDDTLVGGNGKDTYTIDLYGGIDTIDNYATDGEIDTLIFAAKFDDIVSNSYPSTSHLYLTRVGSTGNKLTGAIIKNWFLNEHYRHLILVSEDGIVLNVSSTKDTFVKLQPILADMSLIQINQPQSVGSTFSRVLDLSADRLLTEVVTIFGSSGNDLMIGNHKNNYMRGEKGYDRMEGKEGADVYVVKQGDGTKKIVNYARDDSLDTILFEANFSDIILSSSGQDLVISADYQSVTKGGNGIDLENKIDLEFGNEIDLDFGKKIDQGFRNEVEINLLGDGDYQLGDEDVYVTVTIETKTTKVTLENWFRGKNYQHMVVRSVDGVVFELPTQVGSLEKTIRAVDYSKKNTTEQITLTGMFAKVQRVVGSQGYDTITGNSLSNYMDPQLGRCKLQGNDGGDTYVVKPEYGKGNIINNLATDNYPDTLLFSVPFFSIKSKIRGSDIQLTSITGKGHVNLRLKNYVIDEKSRHLTIISDDGVTFVLPAYNNFQPIPIMMNRAQLTTGQHINLTANSSYAEVRTVYGASRYQNYIIGNDQNNTIVGGSEADHIEGLGGDDVLKGGASDDTLIGGPGADTLVGGAGNDVIYGGEDDDIISPGLGTNQVYGGPGSDTVIYSGDVSSEEGIHLNLAHGMCIHEKNIQDTLSSVENAFGTEYDDMLQGDDEDNVLVGQGGDDYLSPGAGYDILNGGNGNDTYDLATANGTVTLENYATDRALDKVIMTYARKVDFRYEKSGDNLIVRVINTEYPVFYDGSKPTVIFKGWFIDSRTYHHAYIAASDGIIESKYLKRHARKAAYIAKPTLKYDDKLRLIFSDCNGNSNPPQQNYLKAPADQNGIWGVDSSNISTSTLLQIRAGFEGVEGTVKTGDKVFIQKPLSDISLECDEDGCQRRSPRGEYSAFIYGCGKGTGDVIKDDDEVIFIQYNSSSDICVISFDGVRPFLSCPTQIICSETCGRAIVKIAS